MCVCVLYVRVRVTNCDNLSFVPGWCIHVLVRWTQSHFTGGQNYKTVFAQRKRNTKRLGLRSLGQTRLVLCRSLTGLC